MAHVRARMRVHEPVTPAFLMAAGVVAAVTSLYVVITETRLVEGTFSGGYLEVLMLAVPAVGLFYAGYWLWDSDFDPDDVWCIGRFAVGGGLAAAVVTGFVLVGLSIPVIGPSATFVLFVSTGTEGSLLGVLVGTFAVTDRLFRRERAAADAYETLHALLRHDMRNRLTVIGGHLARLSETPEAPADAVATIEAQLEAIEALLTDTGVATEALRGEPMLQSIDLAGIVREQLALLEASYDRVSAAVDLPDRAAVQADDLLASVVSNLLTNAVVHHDRPVAELEVAVGETNGRVRLDIADDGPGIPADRREAVFEPGVGEGSGMGLYLVQTIVECYGGSIRLRENEPRGTVVSVTLPRAADDT